MRKEEKLFKKEELLFLNQLIKAMEDAEAILEKAYEKKDYDKFNKAKKFMYEAQEKMAKIMK